MSSQQRQRRQRVGLKCLAWLLCLAPSAYMLWQLFTDGLGPNPVEALIRSTGDWALRGLCVVLAMTPLQVVTGWSALARLRRILGLFAFFYAALHALVYCWLEMAWSWRAIWDDVLQRWFIVAGLAAWVIVFTLAVSSHHAILRTMGGQSWKRLHQGVHAAAWLALLHFFWMRSGKNDVVEVLVYAAIIGWLQAWRVVRWLRNRRRARWSTAVRKAPH